MVCYARRILRVCFHKPCRRQGQLNSDHRPATPVTPTDNNAPASLGPLVAQAITKEDQLGKEPIPSLLLRMSLPAAMGFLALTTYQLVDTVFIGHYVGVEGLGGIAVVMPIVLLISSLGRGLGVGGGSIIARSLGAEDRDRAEQTLSHLFLLCLLFSALTLVAGIRFTDPILGFFGAQGAILPSSRDYFLFLLPGLPFLSFSMLSNNVIRAAGNARKAMQIMIFPALINVLLDPLFIAWFGWGMRGAALATTISYLGSSLFALTYFISNRGPLRLRPQRIRPSRTLSGEILSIGATPIARQGMGALLAVVMNTTLFAFGGELAVASYGMVHRLHMFVMFPIIGLNQGFIPICGYNLGAGHLHRVRSVIRLSLRASILIGCLLATLLWFFASQLVTIFTPDPDLIRQSGFALGMVFLLLPLAAIQLLCAVYFQARGKALASLTLTLLRQGFLLIPLVLLLPRLFGLTGIWYAFPVADLLACLLSLLYTIPKWRALYPPPTGQEPRY
jgi:putative MATE family efflux protein